MDSLPTPGTVFLTSLLDIEEDTRKGVHNNSSGAQYHPTQQQSPPSSESKSTPQTTVSGVSGVQDAPVQDYSQFQQEIERRFRQARESARAANKPRVIIPQQQLVPAINPTPQTISPEMKNETCQPIYTPIDFDPAMSFSSTPVDLGMSASDMPNFDTFFTHSVEEPSFQYGSPFSHEAAKEPIPENKITQTLSVTRISDDLMVETAPGFQYESPTSQEVTQEFCEPIPKMNAKRPPPVTTVSDDLVVQTVPKKAKTSTKKDGKPRSRRTLSDSQVKQKRESFLERNRVAAMKCRSKRKDYVQQLHDDMRIRSEENEELRMMHKGLTEEIESLKNMLGRCNDTQKKNEVEDNEKITGTTEEMSDKEKTDFMDVLIKDGPRRLG